MATAQTNRLPRFERAEGALELHLTDRDVNEILAVVYMLRLANSEQIQALVTGSKQQILRRLQKLFHAGLLDRITPRVEYRAGSQPMVYAISNTGIQTLENEGIVKISPQTDYNHKNRALGEPFIRHTLLVSQFRAVVTLACRDHPGIELRGWRQGRAIQDSIQVPLGNSLEEIPVAADGFFTLGMPEGKARFFLEADRGSMSIPRFTKKIIGFHAWWRAGRYTEKFGSKFFRVLTVTSSRKRLHNLVAASRGIPEVKKNGKMFLFTTEDQLQLEAPGRIFEKIWTSVAEDEPCSIL